MIDGAYQDEMQGLRAEVEALKADNAALVALLDPRDEEETDAETDAWAEKVLTTLAQPHPGTALLEEHRAALATITEERERMRPAWDRLSAIALKQGRSFGLVLADAENHRADLAAAAARHETTRATIQVREEEHRKAEQAAFMAGAATTSAELTAAREEVASLREAHRTELVALRTALEQARYADDNAKAFTEAFCETAEAAVQHALAPKGGQHVPFHGDFGSVPPSTVGRLRWWAACGRAALNGEASSLLVRARNEALAKAAREADRAADLGEVARDACDGEQRRTWAAASRWVRDIAAAIRAMKETES